MMKNQLLLCLAVGSLTALSILWLPGNTFVEAAPVAPPKGPSSVRYSPSVAGITNALTVVRSSSAPNGTNGFAFATCPSGTIAIGGGIDTSNVAFETVSASAPYFSNGQSLQYQPDGTNPAPIGWLGAIINNTGTTRTVKAGAVCANAYGVSTRIASSSVPNSTIGGIGLNCPSGVVLSGGIDAFNTLYERIHASAPEFSGGVHLKDTPDGTYPAPTGWFAALSNNTGSTMTLKVGIICANVSGVSTIVGSGSAGSYGFAYLTCPAGNIAIGGGVEGNDNDMEVSSSAPDFADTSSLQVRPDGTNPAPVGWHGTMINNSLSTKTVKAAVICAPRAFAVLLPLIMK